MPKDVALLPVRIWRDPSFTELPADAQRLYLLMATQHNLNQAGYIALTPRRWANRAADTSPDDIMAALAKLEENQWAWVDHDLQEVLIRPHTRPAAHKQLQGALQATFDMSSKRLRQIAATLFVDPVRFGPESTRKVTAFTRMRLAVYEKSSYTCQACGWKPDVPDGYDGRYALGTVYLDELRGSYRVRILELDHIYPDFLGGKFELSNLRALCNSCNASKGARVA